MCYLCDCMAASAFKGLSSHKDTTDLLQVKTRLAKKKSKFEFSVGDGRRRDNREVKKVLQGKNKRPARIRTGVVRTV